jgi:hypothetical protein
METIHIIPVGFISLNIFFNIVFMLFTGLIAFYSFKVFRISGEKESKNFGLAFAFLSVSYLFLSFLHKLFLSAATGGLRSLNFDDVIGLKNSLVLIYSLFFILGFTTLFYTILKIKSGAVYFIMVILSILGLGFSNDRSLVLYSIASIFLILIVTLYAKEFRRTNNVNTLTFGFSMLMLLISSILKIICGDYLMPLAYVLSVLVEAAAYSIIIYCLFRIIKNGKKKK